MSSGYERSAEDANRQEIVDQLGFIVRRCLVNYFKKSGRYVAETSNGIGYVTLRKARLEGASLWLSRAREYQNVHILDKPNGVWVVSQYTYRTNGGEADLLEASSSALKTDSTDEIEPFATFFENAGRDLIRIPENVDHFYF